MVHFNEISLATFLSDYWQKKPLVIRQALPQFINPISPDELAGLSLEEDVESRLVIKKPDSQPEWHLRRGPFSEDDFQSLPEKYWTLLVQGVDRIVPEVYALLDHFDFIPQWRIDDVMISFASQNGSVGPHYDNYDVFLYQALGQREWALTTQKCTTDNYIPDLELRIMNEFAVEERFILEEGDMLYLPPHVGHYGISLSDECMTYSFGYRSYQGQEVLDSLGEYIAENESFKNLYRDPNWSELKNTAEISSGAWQNAQNLLIDMLKNDEMIKSWFGCFATRLDQSAEQQLPEALTEEEFCSLEDFITDLKESDGLERNACCRFAYQKIGSGYQLYINGCEWPVQDCTEGLITLIANNRVVEIGDLVPYLDSSANQSFLYELSKLQWLNLI